MLWHGLLNVYLQMQIFSNGDNEKKVQNLNVVMSGNTFKKQPQFKNLFLLAVN